MLSRRDLLKRTGQIGVASCLPSTMFSLSERGGPKATRCINVVNFIRAIEPRFETDLLLPVQKQMESIVAHGLPATWLLQFDALVSGPFVQFLKDQMAKDHEVGIWFEMNEMHCKAAGVNWRGRPGFEWDHLPPVAFTIGYTPEERIKLADTAMKQFKETWGHYPKSVASWNLDAFTIDHLTEHYGIDAYAVCRDQIATDGFTIWGAPIAGYYPSKINCWSPALDKKNQISTPIFRMLGQDPVYYYDRTFKLPNGKRIGEPDTMEPCWTSGQSPHFVETFLRMISETPTQEFAYAQMGQENSFPWDQQGPAYDPQMKALAELRSKGLVHVETMGASGRRFKKSYSMTPTQAQVQLVDPFENTDQAEASIWYQSRFYRANLHIKGDLAYLRDITVYSDKFPQPFLEKATRLNDVEQKMPPVLDGYHWRNKPTSEREPGAGGFFSVNGIRLQLTSRPVVEESGKTMNVKLPVSGNRALLIRFEEKQISIDLGRNSKESLDLAFEWDPAKANLTDVQSEQVRFRSHELDYFVGVIGGNAMKTQMGWSVSTKTFLVLQLEQPG